LESRKRMEMLYPEEQKEEVIVDDNKKAEPL